MYANRREELTLAVAGLITMFAMGWILLPVFALWDLRYAKRPVIARRFLANRTIVCAAWIGFFDFVRAAPFSARSVAD